MSDSNPRPELPPVTIITFPSKEGMSLSGLKLKDENGNMAVGGNVRCCSKLMEMDNIKCEQLSWKIY